MALTERLRRGRYRQALETMLLYVVNASFQPEEISIEIAIEGRKDESWVRLMITGRGSTPSRIGLRHAHSAGNSDFTRLGVQLYLTNQIALAHLGTFAITSASLSPLRKRISLCVVPMNCKLSYKGMVGCRTKEGTGSE